MITSSVSGWLFKPQYWLPFAFDWDDLKEVKWPVASDILYSIPVAFVIIVCRLFIERYILHPWSLYVFGRKSKAPLKTPRKSNSLEELLLEEAYRINKKSLTFSQLEVLAKKLDWSVRDVERWLRKKAKLNKQSTLDKFKESGWRFLCYVGVTSGSLYVLWDKPWLWDVNACYLNYPFQNISEDVRWLYILITGFYWSLLLTLLVDTKRKDFGAVASHHVATLVLLSFSWVSNFVRIGTLVSLTHDCSDVLLEAAKLFTYAKRTLWANFTFGLFTLLWIATRLVIYPFYIYKSVLEVQDEIKTTVVGRILTGALAFLICLNIYWTYFICLCLIKVVATGEGEDFRSSAESEDESTNEAKYE